MDWSLHQFWFELTVWWPWNIDKSLHSSVTRPPNGSFRVKTWTVEKVSAFEFPANMTPYRYNRSRDVIGRYRWQAFDWSIQIPKSNRSISKSLRALLHGLGWQRLQCFWRPVASRSMGHIRWSSESVLRKGSINFRLWALRRSFFP